MNILRMGKKKLHEIVFGGVVLFIEELVINATDTITAFKLSDLIKLLSCLLERPRNNTRNKNT